MNEWMKGEKRYTNKLIFTLQGEMFYSIDIWYPYLGILYLKKIIYVL